MKSKTTTKKTPADYPQMIFRVSQADKDRLAELVEKVTQLHNEFAVPEGRKKIRKNDVIVDSLFYGLLHFERGLLKRKANG